MCGLTGFWRSEPTSELRSVIMAMTDTIIHRGPDAGAVWIDEDAGFALGHRRLSILELSEQGAQPMQSACTRFVLVYNGEVYNHLELRQELKRNGHEPAWRGHSDTETLLACFVFWGVKATLRKAVGMFAFALWDKTERTLTLARDRFGEKPLYYGWVGQASAQTFVFGSELKSLRAYPGFDNPINRGALGLYFQFCTVPAP